MKCPLCNGKTIVLESRSSGSIKYRRRRCKECGQAFYTEELLSDGTDQRHLQAEAERRKYREACKAEIERAKGQQS